MSKLAKNVALLTPPVCNNVVPSPGLEGYAVATSTASTELIAEATIYSNLMAVMCNAGEEGCIFANKFHLFENADIAEMLGMYVLDGLSPLPQLAKKCNHSQRNQPMAMI